MRESSNLESYQNNTETVMDEEGGEGRRTMEGIYKGSTANCASTGLYVSQIDPHEIIHSLSRGLHAGAYPIRDGTPPEQPYGSSHFSSARCPQYAFAILQPHYQTLFVIFIHLDNTWFMIH